MKRNETKRNEKANEPAWRTAYTAPEPFCTPTTTTTEHKACCTLLHAAARYWGFSGLCV
jgi:hypothetical protein